MKHWGCAASLGVAITASVVRTAAQQPTDNGSPMAREPAPISSPTPLRVPPRPSRSLAPITLDDVLRSTDRAHPLLTAAELDVDAATGESMAAEGGFDASWKTRASTRPIGYYDTLIVDSVVEKPTSLWGVTTFAGWRLGVNKFPIYDEKYRTLEYGEWRAGVNVPVLRNGPIDRRRASLTRAELGRDIAQLTYAQQRIELRRAAAHRYWGWVAAGKKLDIAEVLLDNVEARQAAVSARVRSGDLPSIEEADNARAMEQRRSQVALALRSLEQTSLELSLFLRSERGDPILPQRQQLPADWPTLTEEPLTQSVDIDRALAQRPEPQRLRLQREQHSVELEFTQNQQLPSLDFQVVGSRDFGPPLLERPDLSEPVLEVGVLLDVPLQNRVNQGRAAALRAQVERTTLQQRFASERVSAEVRDAFSAVQRAKQRITIVHREVALAHELEAAERERFSAGDSQLLIVNLREQQTAEAQLREVDALLDYYRALADWHAARGD